MRVLVDKRSPEVRLTLDRPPLNVLNLPLIEELDSILDAVGVDPTVDLVILAGSGEKAFSAGVDIGDHARERAAEMLRVVHGAMRKLLALPQVTIALVRGACLGGGLELAACCDLIVASEDSTFATPEISVGCYPPVALVSFPSLIGHHRAAELILTGRQFSAAEALAMGFVNRSAPRAELESALESLLEELRSKSAAVLRLALKGLREIRLKNFAADLARAEELYLSELLKTEDVEEGVQAFLAKRKPNWKHR